MHCKILKLNTWWSSERSRRNKWSNDIKHIVHLFKRIHKNVIIINLRFYIFFLLSLSPSLSHSDACLVGIFSFVRTAPVVTKATTIGKRAKKLQLINLALLLLLLLQKKNHPNLYSRKVSNIQHSAHKNINIISFFLYVSFRMKWQRNLITFQLRRASAHGGKEQRYAKA